MPAYLIENSEGVKEEFRYERPLNADSQHALLEYARANYGANAGFRAMTKKEEEAFSLRVHKPSVNRASELSIGSK